MVCIDILKFCLPFKLSLNYFTFHPYKLPSQEDEKSRNPVDNYLLVVLAGVLGLSLIASIVKLIFVSFAIFATAFKYSAVCLLLLLVGVYLAA